MRQLAAAAALGIGAGLAPGPLHSLILTTALRSGARPAVRVAMAPLLSDALPVAVSLLLAAALPPAALRVLAVVGGCALVVMAARTLRDPREGAAPSRPSADFAKGAIANLLNPSPWVFWLGAGAPMLATAFGEGWPVGVGWLVVFYGGLVGTKVVFAIGVARAGTRLGTVALRRSVVMSAVLLAGVGVWLVVGGVVGPR